MNSAILILTNEFTNRKKKNPSYSLRKFSKDLGLSPSLVVSIFKGRRSVSPRTARVILNKVRLESYEEVLLKSFLDDNDLDPQILNESKVRQIHTSYAKYLTDWKFQYISEFLISYPDGLSLDELNSLVGKNIGRVDLFVIMTTLETAGIVVLKEYKYYIHEKYNLNFDFKDSYLLEYHEKFLNDILSSIKFLKEHDEKRRLLASLTFSIDEKLFEDFSNDLRTFLIKLCEKYESKSKSKKIFQLTFQGIYPSDHF